ncbi:hypothetical protein HPS57_10495 [Prevotella sp. PINT]|jgi:hypothetical protein|uniref:HNH endonuclease n=1 Tax=Palleniella intestinalis TaxID=2736291 RepID=UPI0015537499|nr:HNH endonuclease [Palleniella intestinalis]NPD82397.1 hypothetical protein [Palleniella intestinalis]
MKQYNKQITDWLNAKFKNIFLDAEDGHTLSDKAYAFDTMFFMSRFIEHFRFGNMFHKRDHINDANEYTRYLFMLDKGAKQIPNYLTEALAVLCFAGVLKTEKANRIYKIIDEEMLLFISSSFENAYIFNYMLVYNIYQTYNWWNLYVEFCKTKEIGIKKEILQELRHGMYASNPAFGTVNKPQTSNYPMFVTKQHIEVLNFANKQNHVTRTGNIKDRICSIEDMALNVSGTRNNYGFAKKNDYLYTFDENYVRLTLKPYLTIDVPNTLEITYSPSLAEDIADGKLKLFDKRDNIERKRKSQNAKYKQTASGRVRTVQGEFRRGLLENTPKVCPICGFSYETFLIASHILPYAKCEDTYDAMNSNNGLLMCPICDKLFESAKYMTVDAKTGKVKYLPELENEPDFQYLHDKEIDYLYIDGERRHYLKWHNEEFERIKAEKNKS